MKYTSITAGTVYDDVTGETRPATQEEIQDALSFFKGYVAAHQPKCMTIVDLHEKTQIPVE